MAKNSIIGVDLGGVNVRVGRITNHKIEEFHEITISHESDELTILNEINTAINKLFNENIAGIGFGVPGTIDINTGIVYEIQRIPSWRNIPLKEHLEKEFNVPVYVNNDANCFALGVKYYGEGIKHKNVVGLILGEGLGAGVILDDRLYSGTSCGAGEYGKIPYCEAVTETYTSTQFFKTFYNTTFEEIYEKALQNDPVALDAFKKFGENLSNVIEIIIYSVDPEFISLGGIVARAFDLFKDSMWARLNNIVYKQSLEKLKIEATSNPLMPLIGAAALYYDAQQAKIFERERARRKNAERETHNILNNVEEGLFLLNPDFEIGSRFSKILKTIMAETKISGMNFLNWVQNATNQSIHDGTKDFLECMFNSSLDESTLYDLNPLAEVYVKTSDKMRKYLTFRFRRVNTIRNNIDELFVTVRDITSQIELRQKLQKSEEKTDKQMKWLFSILHVEPEMLKEFIGSVQNELDYIDIILDRFSPTHADKETLLKVYRSMHLIKGNASLLNLTFFAEDAHDAENAISEIRKKPHITDDDLKHVTDKTIAIREMLSEIHGMFDRLSKLHQQMRPKRSFENKMLVQSLENLINQLNTDLGKDVVLNAENFNGNDIPHRYYLHVKDVLIQLVRNSVSHGIELKEDRLKAGKPVQGVITICTEKSGQDFKLWLKDDGRGLQLKKLASKLKDAGYRVDDMDVETIADGIFLPGITTHDQVDIHAGRGIGLDGVKERITQHCGDITVNHEPGLYCEFVIRLPLLEENIVEPSNN